MKKETFDFSDMVLGFIGVTITAAILSFIIAIFTGLDISILNIVLIELAMLMSGVIVKEDLPTEVINSVLMLSIVVLLSIYNLSDVMVSMIRNGYGLSTFINIIMAIASTIIFVYTSYKYYLISR